MTAHSTAREKLRNKQVRKAISGKFVDALTSVNSSYKAYYKTLLCQNDLVVSNDGEISSPFYCKRRWCKTCACIKTATLINRYASKMETLKDPCLVTLTRPTPLIVDLRSRISEQYGAFRKITDLARKRGIKLTGIRALEVAASDDTRYVHPHFHLIIEGFDAASFVVEQWLRLNKDARRKAQDISLADMSDKKRGYALELLKYVTKFPSDVTSMSIDQAIQYDAIFQAIHGRRVVNSFGDLPVLDDEAFDITKENLPLAADIYTWSYDDWYSRQTGLSVRDCIL